MQRKEHDPGAGTSAALNPNHLARKYLSERCRGTLLTRVSHILAAVTAACERGRVLPYPSPAFWPDQAECVEDQGAF